ncbi:hypothetical protein Poli38472_006610 [Pythium oligandrum]|uniref:Ubiquitin-like domain-containing protein n=1 Tax=Pythium oligandrum TaxID=41045 RepID=A0A8K1C586_PYTOL|nr:hypothetical protein Poli38472_006610 [Pythium oligandrum]|eukprot:TMW56600.1 hypothetical protein Poli38472_006610 [Pythium oligandrum]
MELVVGDRIEDERGSRGTIRYIGSVATSKDASTVYYGVEWDEWGRGLNDGSVTLPSGERVVYFDGPAGRISSPHGTLEYKCSFLKKAKLLAGAKRATLIERLLERYDRSAADGEQGGDEENGGKAIPGRDAVVTGEVGTTLGSQRPIELVGVQKLRTQQKLDTIEKISLSHCQITSLGASVTSPLATLAPQITELDLSFNLLRSWDAVFEIIEELPLLDSLMLSGNRLRYDSAKYASQLEGRRYANVKALVLNQTFIAWEQLGAILHRHFPSITELYLASNGISDGDLAQTLPSEASDTWLKSLEILDLSDNGLKSWKVIENTLGTALVNLKQLIVNNNQISTLSVTSESTASPFAELNSLSLNYNLIDTWSSIDALNKFERLHSLRFMRNPLTAQMGVGEARTLVIARAAYLQVFNASPIQSKERTDAEQMYLKRILHELAAAKDSKEQEATVLASHRRYKQLCGAYPDVVASATARGGGTGGPTTLGSSLIQVKIIPMTMNATTFDPLTKRMPQTMKLSQIKILVEKKFGIPSGDQLLAFRMDAKSMPQPLDDDSCELSYYGLQDEAEILVNDSS